MLTLKKKISKEELKSLVFKHKKLIVLAAIVFTSFAAGFLSRDLIPVAAVNNETIRRPVFIQALLKFGGKQVLNTLVTEKLILQEAKKKRVTVSRAEIDEKIEQLTKQLKTNNVTLQNFLAYQQKTKSEFEKEVRFQLIVEKLFKTEVKINDVDIENYFSKTRIQKGTGAILASQKIAINRILYQQQMREKLVQWLKNQQKISKVKIFIRI